MTDVKKKRNPVRMVLTILEAIIVIVLVAYSIYTIVNIRNEGQREELNFIFGKSWLPVLTNSMDGDKPDSFKANDLVIDRKYNGEDLEVGDIVTYYGNIDGVYRFNTHRIVRIELDNDGNFVGYRTRGDNYETNPTEDMNILTKGAIKGVYVKHYSGLGAPFNWLQVPNHFLLAILVPLIVLVLVNAIDLVRMIMKMNAKKIQAQYAGTAPKETEEEMRARIMAELMAEKEAANDQVKADAVQSGNAFDEAPKEEDPAQKENDGEAK